MTKPKTLASKLPAAPPCSLCINIVYKILKEQAAQKVGRDAQLSYFPNATLIISYQISRASEMTTRSIRGGSYRACSTCLHTVHRL